MKKNKKHVLVIEDENQSNPVLILKMVEDRIKRMSLKTTVADPLHVELSKDGLEAMWSYIDRLSGKKVRRHKYLQVPTNNGGVVQFEERSE